jgi:hypothetical protein
MPHGHAANSSSRLPALLLYALHDSTRLRRIFTGVAHMTRRRDRSFTLGSLTRKPRIGREYPGGGQGTTVGSTDLNEWREDDRQPYTPLAPGPLVTNW